MGDFATEPPRPNGQDTDNDLLYKIAIRLFGPGGVFAGLTDAQFAARLPLAVSLPANTSTTAATLTQALKTVAATGTPEALGSGLVESVAIRPKKTRTTANTGNVWIQNVVTNDLAGGWELAPTDAPLVLSAPVGKKIDLAAIFIDVATNGDGVIYTAVN